MTDTELREQNNNTRRDAMNENKLWIKIQDIQASYHSAADEQETAEYMQLFKEHTERQQRELLDRLEVQIADDKPLTTVNELVNVWQERIKNDFAAERANLNNNQPTSLNGEEKI